MDPTVAASSTCRMCNVDHAPGTPACPLARVGKTIGGRYRLDRMLGCGGMGAVYDAENIALGRRVAIKMLHLRFAAMPAIVARFQREARSVAGLHHPGFPQVHALEKLEDGSLAIEMELLKGTPVDALVSAGPVPIERVLAILDSALDALAVAHGAGLVHRDLKPENLFWCDAPQPHVKILDFGIARADDGQQLTTTGQMFGTISYASPEQLKDSGRADARSDVYSLGATAYEIVTGETPAGRGTQTEVMARILTGSIERHAAKLRPDVPAWLDDWIARALSADPTQRFANASDMRDAARSARSGGPATLPLATAQTMAPAPTMPVTAAAVSATAPGAVAAAAATAPVAPTKPLTSDKLAAAPTTAAAAPRRGLLIAAAVGALAVIAIVIVIATRGPSATPTPDASAIAKTPPADAEVRTVDTAPAIDVRSPVVPAGPPLLVDLTVWRASGGGEQALAPRAKLRAGDKIAFQVATSDRAYVYVLQRIGDEIDVLFPSASGGGKNPLVANKPVRVPAKSYFQLVDDGIYGTTTITVIASATHLADLESILAATTAQRGSVQATQKARDVIKTLGDPAVTGAVSRGHLEPLDDTQRRVISVRYRQRPEDPLVVAAFDFDQVK